MAEESVASSAAAGADGTRSFKVVFIPQDTSQPIEERECRYTEDTKVSCLMDMAKQHFRTVQAKDVTQGREM